MYKPYRKDERSNYLTLDAMMNSGGNINHFRRSGESKSESPDTCVHIMNSEHRKSLLEQNEVVCVYISGDFCQPCKELFPKFVEFAMRYNISNKCALVKERVEDSLTKDYQVTAVPSFIFYKNGSIVRNEKGTVLDVVGGDFEQISKILNMLLNQKN